MCVFALMAWTKAPSNGVLSGTFTLPVTVAARTSEEKTATKIKNATSLLADRMLHLVITLLSIPTQLKEEMLFLTYHTLWSEWKRALTLNEAQKRTITD